MPTARLDEVVAHLDKIREEHGDQAYQTARLALAKQLVMGPNGEEFLQRAWPDLDVAEVRRLAEGDQKAKQAKAQQGQLPEQVMVNMMKDQIPNLKTQGQFDLFMTAFNALREHLNSVFGGDADGAQRTRAALIQTLDLAPKLTEMAERLQEIPEEEQSDDAKNFAAPPKQFDEQAVFQNLMVELEQIETFEKLQQWYAAKREQMDRIVDQKLRDKLFDCVRHRRQALAN